MKRILQMMLPCLLLAALGVQAQNEQQMFWQLNRASFPVPVVQYALKKVNPKYTGNAIQVRNAGGTPQDIPFLADGNLDEATLYSHLSITMPQAGFAAGYSLRKIKSDYTGSAIKVRNSAGAEQEIGFDENGNLDETALLNHVKGNIPQTFDAAYSLRKVKSDYTGPAIRVRRDGDNAEWDIGFGQATKYISKTGYITTDWTDVNVSSISELNEIAYVRINADGGSMEASEYTHFTKDGQNVDWSAIPTGTINYTFWAVVYSGSNGIYHTKSIQIELNKTGGQWQVRGLGTAYLLNTNNVLFDFDNDTPSGTGLVATSATGAGYGVPSFTMFNADEGDDLHQEGLLAFAIGKSVFVTTFYDQSGNNVHALQTVPALQPRIVLNGTINKLNGKPAIDFGNPTGAKLISTASMPVTSANHVFAFGVWNKYLASGNGLIFCLDFPTSLGPRAYGFFAATGDIYWDAPNAERVKTQGQTNEGQFGDFNQHQFTFTKTAGADRKVARRDGVEIITATEVDTPTALDRVIIGDFVDQIRAMPINIQELVFYTDNQWDNKEAIEASQISYWLDRSNAYVTTLYDQSGNDVHAYQTIASNQPQIVSNGAVIKANNKPAIDFSRNSSTVLVSTESLPVTSAPNVFVFGVWRKNQEGGMGVQAFNLNYPSTTGPRAYASWGNGDIYWDAPFAERINTTNAAYDDIDLHQFTFTKTTGAGNKKARRDGVTVVSGTAAVTPTPVNQVVIGNFNITNSAITHMDFQEMIVYTDDQTSNLETIEASQANYWISGGYVTTFYDQSGNGIHATQATEAWQPEIVTGVNSGFTFDGDNDVLSSPNTNTIGAGINKFTINLKLNSKADPAGNPDYVHEAFTITDGGEANDGGLGIRMSTAEVSLIVKPAEPTGKVDTSFPGSYPLNTDHFITFVCDAPNNTIDLYRNGVFVEQKVWSVPTDFTLADNIVILGSRLTTNDTYDYSFEGQIKSASLYQEILTAAQIRKLYNQNPN